MFNTIDLFAGAGGLSLGFMQTKKFDIKVAYEFNPAMQETYKKNHPGVAVFGDVRDANFAEIKEKYGDIDVVIGGPPCQGFSNAKDVYKRQDNSIAANAKNVDIYFFPIDGAYIAILDNGKGMTEKEIDIAMQYGSKNPTEERDKKDLGRFGLGLKTASLSQCRCCLLYTSLRSSASSNTSAIAADSSGTSSSQLFSLPSPSLTVLSRESWSPALA